MRSMPLTKLRVVKKRCLFQRPTVVPALRPGPAMTTHIIQQQKEIEQRIQPFTAVVPKLKNIINANRLG